MSAYLKFVLERAGTPVPKRVVIVPHAEEWANHQLGDEFEAVFPSVEAVFETSPALAPGELLVLPFMDSFSDEAPGGTALIRSLTGTRDAWVMLYGLRARRISVLPARRVGRHHRECRRSARFLRTASRLRLIGWLRRLAHAWVPR